MCDSRRLVPVARHIIQIQLDDGPESRGNVGSVSVCNEVVRVFDQCSRSKSGPVSLRPTYAKLLDICSKTKTSHVCLPHEPVNAVSLMLNLGSPSPPVLTVPEGLVSCCKTACAETYSSIRELRLVSAPETYSSTSTLNTNDASRIQLYK